MKDSDQKYFLNERLWSNYFSMWDSDQKYFNNLLPCCRRHQLLSRQRRERRRATTWERFLQLLNLCTKGQTKTRPRSRSRPPLKECQNFGLFARKRKQKKKKERWEGRPPGKDFCNFWIFARKTRLIPDQDLDQDHLWKNVKTLDSLHEKRTEKEKGKRRRATT